MTAILGACVRLYDTGPELHTNPAHVALDVASVHVGPDDGFLWIVHASSAPVVAILCSPDETLTSRGITAGASGGTNYSRVRFAEHGVPLDLRDPAHYAKVAGSSSNLWYAVVHAAAPATPRLDRLERIVRILEAGSGWSFDALTLAYPSFDAVRASASSFDELATPTMKGA